MHELTEKLGLLPKDSSWEVKDRAIREYLEEKASKINDASCHCSEWDIRNYEIWNGLKWCSVHAGNMILRKKEVKHGKI